MNEFELIQRIAELAATSNSCVKRGIGDDLAVLRVGGETLLIGSDMLVDGVHFRLESDSPRQIGHKALAVCLSDCAAMAAVPVAAVVSFAKPASMSASVIEEIYVGLTETANRFACPIVGGDSVSTGDRFVIDVVVLASSAGVEPILRSGAKVGDAVIVTGTLGGSIEGKHLTFEPRIALARTLATCVPLHAMMDLSDGLSSDMNHICDESACGVELYAEAIAAAASDAARRREKTMGRSLIEQVLSDGEDFELLATVGGDEQTLEVLKTRLNDAEVPIRVIGRIVEASRGRSIVMNDGSSQALTPKGYRHF